MVRRGAECQTSWSSLVSFVLAVDRLSRLRIHSHSLNKCRDAHVGPTPLSICFYEYAILASSTSYSSIHDVPSLTKMNRCVVFRHPYCNFLLFGVINPIQCSFNGIWLVSHEQTEHFLNLSLSLEAHHARRRRGALELQRSWEGDKNPPHTFQTSNADSQCNFLKENTRKQPILAHFHHQALGRRPQNARWVIHDELKGQNPLTYGSHETGSSCRYDDEFL